MHFCFGISELKIVWFDNCVFFHIWESKIKGGCSCAGSTGTGRPVPPSLKQLETRLEVEATCVLRSVWWQEWFAMVPSRITRMTGNSVDKINLQIRYRKYTDLISVHLCFMNKPDAVGITHSGSCISAVNGKLKSWVTWLPPIEGSSRSHRVVFYRDPFRKIRKSGVLLKEDYWGPVDVVK